jgi:type IV pilus assembly protein PilA
MRAYRSGRGFTLVEVIVVIVIIAILAAIGVPALTGYIEKAHEKELIAVANTSAKALQTWATEQYAYGNIGNEKLMDSAADSFSIVGYTGESGLFDSNGSADGGIVTADYHPGSGDRVVNGTESSEGIFLPASVPDAEFYKFTVTLSYHFIDKSGIDHVDTYNYGPNWWTEDYSEPTYAKAACGEPRFVSGVSITPPALPEGYRARADTQELIDSGVALSVVTISFDGSIDWVGAYSGHLYYEAYGEDDDEEGEDEDEGDGGNEEKNEDGNEDEAASSGWINIVDLLASTKYGSEGYVITDVEFSGQNLLTHMKLTAPNGDFVVYADETYHYNLDPTMGSST